MYSLLQSDGVLTVNSFAYYLYDFLKRAGKPTDPIAVELLEQMALCSFHAKLLHSKAGQFENGKPINLEAVAVINAAAARCTAEFRKLTLAYKQYCSR